ncbi:MAG: RraA family protein [Blautia sp.]|nr:RraA family protein [Blautia sp.]
MHFNVKEDIIQMTPRWTGERFSDGRPRVSDADLEKLREMTLEECWLMLDKFGYKNQFEGHLKVLHPEKKLVGRAVTASYLPSRPDMFEVVEEIGHAEGRRGTHNLWIVDSLTEGDVVVSDMFDKVREGTYVGGNLSTSIRNSTKTGGAVIWGGIRDLEQILQIDGIQLYFRGMDPTPIKDFCMNGFNVPVRIGNAVCLPGDVVMGNGEGVLFIPAHMVRTVIDSAEKSHCKDLFGFEMIRRGIYQTADIDIDYWPKETLDRLMDFINTDPGAAIYKNIDWSEEYEMARKVFGE